MYNTSSLVVQVSRSHGVEAFQMTTFIFLLRRRLSVLPNKPPVKWGRSTIPVGDVSARQGEAKKQQQQLLVSQ